MRIGKWLVKIDGWSLVFTRIWDEQTVNQWRRKVWSPYYDGYANPMVDTMQHMTHYSAEDVKRWQDELEGHLAGLSAPPLVGPRMPQSDAEFAAEPRCRHGVVGGCTMCQGCDNSGVI